MAFHLRIQILCPSLTPSVTTLPLVHSAVDTPASLLYFKYDKHSPASGPLHVLFLLSDSRYLLLPYLHSGLCLNVISSERPYQTTSYNEIIFITFSLCFIFLHRTENFLISHFSGLFVYYLSPYPTTETPREQSLHFIHCWIPQHLGQYLAHKGCFIICVEGLHEDGVTE